MTALTEEGQKIEDQAKPLFNRAQRRQSVAEARFIIKKYQKGWSTRKIAQALKFPNIDNAEEYVKQVIAFVNKNQNPQPQEPVPMYEDEKIRVVDYPTWANMEESGAEVMKHEDGEPYLMWNNKRTYRSRDIWLQTLLDKIPSYEQGIF